MAHSQATVAVTVLIANKPIPWPFKSLELSQSSFTHHELAVTVALDIEGQEEKKLFLSMSKFQDTLGKSLTVTVVPTDEYVTKQEKLEFVGIINNVSFENDVEKINCVTFHAKSPTWLIDHNKINHFWEKQSLSGVLNDITGKYSIEKGDFKPPSGTPPFLVQFGETDWQFLCRLSSREGKWLYYDGRKLNLDKAKSKNTHNLDWVKHVGLFNLKVNVDHLDYRADVYHEGGKQQYFTDSTKGSASTDLSKLTRKAHSVSKLDFKGKSADSFPQHTDAEDKVVKYLVNRKQAKIGSLVNCNVQSNVPSIKVGDTVKIAGMKDFCGTYFVTEIKHIIDGGNRYYNNFVAVPLEIAHPAWRQPVTKTPPMQAGVVTDNKDPDGRYRVKVQLNYTDENGTQLETPFLRVVTQHAGGDHGSYFLPEIGDEVLVGYERDNPEMPIVLGNLWNGKVKPDKKTVNNDNYFKAIYTKGGNRIEIGDEGGKESIKIINSSKNTITLECDGPKITMHTEGDLLIDAVKNISIKAGENFKIEAGKALDIKAGTNITTMAKKDISVKGQNMDLKAKSDYKLAAMKVTEKANANFETSAGSQMKSSGAMVDISGSAKVTVKGAIIQLN
ncbi:MAG: hypothetical protein KAT58_06510 [candidate division Zixibacteria bacterium]|nr:hypothetical protein [candidate division Zixibacteria bacterium]